MLTCQMQDRLRQNLYWKVTKLRSTQWLGFEALLGNKQTTKWIEQIVWIEFQLQSWLFIVQMNVFSTFEFIFLTQLNYYSYILSFLPMLSISIPLSYELAFEVVVCKKTKLQTRALWMKSNDCKWFGCVNIASFISVKKKL